MVLCVCRNLNKQSGACQRKYFELDHTISGSDKDLNADRLCFVVDALFYLLYSWHCPFKEMLFVLSCYCDLIVHTVPVKKFCSYSPSRSPSKCCVFFPEELFFWEELFCAEVLPFWEELFCAEELLLDEELF